MIQLVCSILALAGSWLAFTTGGIAAGARPGALKILEDYGVDYRDILSK